MQNTPPAAAAPRQTPRVWLAMAIGILACLMSTTCFAQPANKRPGAKANERPFEVVTIETRDGVRLRAAFFPSDKGKDAVPVLIVHEWGGQAGTYLPLGLALNKAGCAVLIPDLRGHGGSMSYPVPGGGTEEFDIGDMGPLHVKAMLAMDLESCKAFLKEKNDKEQLNLNALTLVGIKEGCVLVMEWAVTDWNFPSIGSRKQGQDVKCLVLISPEQIHKGFRVDKAFRDKFVWRLPTMVVAGKDSDEADAADTIYKRLVKLRTRISRGEPEGLKLQLANAKLSGAALLKSDASVTKGVVDFVESEVIAKILQHRWVSRAE